MLRFVGNTPYGHKAGETKMILEILGATNDILSAFAAIAVIAAAIYGGNRIMIWDARAKKERRRVHAERIIVAVYNARSALGRIRSSISVGGNEGSAAEENLKEIFKNENKTEFSYYQINGMICVNRWKFEFDFYNELHECLPFAKAFFGNNMHDAIMSIVVKFNRVRGAADSLAVHRIDDGRSENLLEVIFENYRGEDDKIYVEVNKQVDIIENILFPVIRLEEDDRKLCSFISKR